MTGNSKRQISKGKGVKFHKVFNTLPPHMQDMFTKYAPSAGQKRQEQRKIIDELIHQNPDGSYRLNVRAPMFEDICYFVRGV